jgi:sugar O-acyltransferase (sialic acid O-acetyltransferase NeuD family)
MGKRPLILVGGGGHCKSVIDVAESVGYQILGILDTPDKLGEDVLGYKVIGNDNDIPKFVDKADFIVTIGFIKDSSLRIKLHKLVEAANGNLATIIASTAYVSKYAKVDNGTVIMHKSFVNAGAKIGKGCIINTMANIEHDASIEDFCHISTGVMISGDCIVGKSTFIGSQSVVVNGISVPSNSVFGAASMIRKSFKYEGVYVGNPAIMIKNKNE